jgi:hypothetical protein
LVTATAKARDVLGWTPRLDIDEILARTLVPRR